MQTVTISWSQFTEFFSFIIKKTKTYGFFFFLRSIYSCSNLFTVCKCCHLKKHCSGFETPCSHFLYGSLRYFFSPFTIQPYSKRSIKMKTHSWATCKGVMAQFWPDTIGLLFKTESGYKNKKWQFARACVTLSFSGWLAWAALCVSLELWVSLCVYECVMWVCMCVPLIVNKLIQEKKNMELPVHGPHIINNN